MHIHSKLVQSLLRTNFLNVVFALFHICLEYSIRISIIGPGAVAHACNPSTLEAEASGSQGKKIETVLANMVKPCLY